MDVCSSITIAIEETAQTHKEMHHLNENLLVHENPVQQNYSDQKV